MTTTTNHEQPELAPIDATDDELDAAWFRAPPSRPSIRILRSTPPPPLPPMGDALADAWFR